MAKAISDLSEAMKERDAALEGTDIARAEARLLEKKTEAMGARLREAEGEAEVAAEEHQVIFLSPLVVYCADAIHLYQEWVLPSWRP